MTHRQPDFVIVGAAKSATTWLQRNLQQHSAVFMPGAETHYFSRQFAKGSAWYAAFFEAAVPHQIVGERSNSYLEHPEAPKRLRDALPDVRLIVQLRNPIERLFAHYRAQSEHGASAADPDLGGVDAERLRAGGLYFQHLSRFLELFPREQLCITLYDDLDREPAGVLDHIRAHIGLASSAA
ncbi:MAG TPA: sulfotransferase, partial [Geminicoccaceae bacterium]|nr:sulfotransferase [Geminicoccaceae bacterium]